MPQCQECENWVEEGSICEECKEIIREKKYHNNTFDSNLLKQTYPLQSRIRTRRKIK